MGEYARSGKANKVLWEAEIPPLVKGVAVVDFGRLRDDPGEGDLAMDVNGWSYNGDVGIRHGGHYWRRDEADDQSFHVVKVDPYSDQGGPDNLFKVSVGTLSVPDDAEELAQVAALVGDKPDTIRDSELVVGLLGWGRTWDADAEYVVRVGPVDEFWSGRGEFPDPDMVLRSNASLRNHVVKEFLAWPKPERGMAP